LLLKTETCVGLKAGFPLANFFARSEIFFCHYPISSRWFQLRDQWQMKNSLRAKKFSSGKPALHWHQ
jgi:hypothetical protein